MEVFGCLVCWNRTSRIAEGNLKHTANINRERLQSTASICIVDRELNPGHLYGRLNAHPLLHEIWSLLWWGLNQDTKQICPCQVPLLRHSSKWTSWAEFHMHKSKAREVNLLHVDSPSVFTYSVTVLLIQCYPLLNCKYWFQQIQITDLQKSWPDDLPAQILWLERRLAKWLTKDIVEKGENTTILFLQDGHLTASLIRVYLMEIFSTGHNLVRHSDKVLFQILHARERSNQSNMWS